ncbi:hypothetical protein G0Q06_14100 [Puniceicoccales bacterium CK1056]|uniref:Uncharacterized protein n=1 Tax=Oceanipulchritudo coccoides TaxID=2706888 RepID=A0A6B2M3K0_9BACT|nr:hypothetical protein [Oceanipulchritudo coccoides]NDV63591.1 hypothetical protein [Oceanipulchritudo coccoides]
MDTRFPFFLLLMSFLPLGAQAQIDFIIAGYDQFMVQTSSDKLVPFGFRYNYRFGNNISVEAGIFTSGETITNGTFTGPSFPGGEPLEFWPEDPGYGIEAEVQNPEQVAGVISPGTYTFSGTGNSVGAFSETITIGSYNPLTPLKVTNFNDLMSLDVTQPVTIEWEEFTEGQGPGISAGYAGFVQLRIDGYDQFGLSFSWSSDDFHPEGAFGFLPTRTSFTFPANTFNNNTVYIVNLYFQRIDTASDAVTVPEALVATLTGYEMEFNMNGSFWAGYEVQPSGFVFAQFWIGGGVYVPLAPWVWSFKTGDWLFAVEEVVATDSGWVYVPDLAEGTQSLGLVMVDGTDFGYSHVLERWMYVRPGGLEAGSGWVNLYGRAFF